MNESIDRLPAAVELGAGDWLILSGLSHRHAEMIRDQLPEEVQKRTIIFSEEIGVDVLRVDAA